MNFFRRTAAVALLALPFFAGAVWAQEKSLYQRLGGYDAIASVSEEFVARLVQDEKLKRFLLVFSNDSKGRILQHLIEFICESTGGPCHYLGRDMKTAHVGVGITKDDWTRSNAIFVEVLTKFKVPDAEQKELAALIAPLEKDIVEQQASR